MKNVALITGASAGIGYELSKVFAENDYNLVLVSRDKQRLESVAAEMESQYEIQTMAVAKDLSKPAAPQELYNEIAASGATIEVLVNNAGFGLNGKFMEFSAADHHALIQLNVISLTTLCNLFGRDMVKRRSGSILNVASTAAFQAGPLMSTYFGSKAYVLLLSEALNVELARDGVNVSVLCPGPTRTEFAVRNNMVDTRLLNVPWVMNVDKVAKIGYAGLMQGKMIIIPGFTNRLLAFCGRFTPRSVSALAARFLNQKVTARREVKKA